MPKGEAGFAGYYLQGRVVRILAIWMLPLLLLCLLGVLQVFIPAPPLVRWLLALVLLAVYVYRKTIEDTIDKMAYSWRIGRDAEWDVRNALVEHLGDSFYVLNDVVIPGHGGNIDHIVVGPSGIHAIETKGSYGNVDAMSDRLLVRGYPNDGFLRTCKKRSAALRDFVKHALPGDNRVYPVFPVLVFTRASEVRSRGTTQGVCVEDVPGLVRLLDKFSDRRKLNELERAQVFHALCPHVASRGKRFIQTLGR